MLLTLCPIVAAMCVLHLAYSNHLHSKVYYIYPSVFKKPRLQLGWALNKLLGRDVPPHEVTSCVAA